MRTIQFWISNLTVAHFTALLKISCKTSSCQRKQVKINNKNLDQVRIQHVPGVVSLLKVPRSNYSTNSDRAEIASCLFENYKHYVNEKTFCNMLDQ